MMKTAPGFVKNARNTTVFLRFFLAIHLFSFIFQHIAIYQTRSKALQVYIEAPIRSKA